MLTVNSRKPVQFCDGLTRRDFLRVGALSAGAVGLTLADLQEAAASAKKDVNCILLFLVGGPSHLDTWDPKPNAPQNIRGPFRPIPTKVPGLHIGEHFPHMARLADKYALVRSVHHDEAPIHETGHQLMQTGRLFRGGQEYPHYGAVLSHQRGRKSAGMPPFVVLPGPIEHTGVSVSHGQTAGFLGSVHEPFALVAEGESWPDGDMRLAVEGAQRSLESRLSDGTRGTALGNAFQSIFTGRAKQAFDLSGESSDLRARYGRNTFGQSCLLARRLVENGVRLATVNMFDTVFNRVTWDCHADSGSLASSLNDYRDTLCPMFDRAYSALLTDLDERGLLQNTLVVAMGEFGRTPQLNPRGGRDHWPGCWTILFAGAGIQGGQVVGSSDASGAEPRDRPVTPAEVAATIYMALGIDPRSTLTGPDQRPLPLADAAPIRELF